MSNIITVTCDVAFEPTAEGRRFFAEQAVAPLRATIEAVGLYNATATNVALAMRRFARALRSNYGRRSRKQSKRARFAARQRVLRSLRLLAARVAGEWAS